MAFSSGSTLQQSDEVATVAASTSGGSGGESGGGTGIQVVQVDASGGNVTETLPTPTGGATALALRVDTNTSNTATLETAGSSQEIRFAEGKNVSSTTLGVEQSLLLSSDGSHWYVEEGQGLSAEAEAVTTDAGTKDSPSLTQTATYDSDTSGGVTSSDVSIERYVRADSDGNATLVYESGETEIARLSSGGRFETRKDQEAFMDGSLNAGQGTNSLLQFEDAENNRSTTDLAKLTVKGSGVTVTNPSTDEYVLDISGGGSGSATDILGNGTEVVADATDINFGGGDFDVSQNANNASRTDVTLTNDSVTVAGNSVSLGNSTAINHRDLSNISSSDHHTRYSDEEAQDAVGTILTDSGAASVTYDDAANTITISATDTDTQLSDSEVQTAINNDSDHGSTASHNYTTSASRLSDVSPDSDPDAHHAVFEPADYTPVTTVEAHGNALAIDITGDADTLDGKDGSDYAILSQNEEFTNGLNITGGNVGIGTTSPSAKLEVNGAVHINSTIANRNDAGQERLTLNTDGVLEMDRQMDFELNSDGSRATGSVRWAFVAAGNEKMRIQEDGNVGIGTTSPSYALETAGDMRATGEVEAFLSSDRRLKTGLDPLDSALEKVEALTGYGFDWREGEAVQPHKRGETDVGLIAQEVEGVLPEAVKEFTDGHSEGYKSVSYDKLVPLLVEAIKDLRSQIQQVQ